MTLPANPATSTRLPKMDHVGGSVILVASGLTTRMQEPDASTTAGRMKYELKRSYLRLQDKQWKQTLAALADVISASAHLGGFRFHLDFGTPS